ncbi:hypothetical protein MAR_028212 [Mya arenaria]|uniref:Uncharacterized protein n=1 Tax=Mya arenaria TaxID=6604 RepID=A0ABY7DFM0_MYAAR|nr:hypothetical protein MAR_028212 [Mya arenaria]
MYRDHSGLIFCFLTGDLIANVELRVAFMRARKEVKGGGSPVSELLFLGRCCRCLQDPSPDSRNLLTGGVTSYTVATP